MADLLDRVLDIPPFLDRRPKAEPHVDRAHAKRAPSAAHRWWACPGSIRMSEGVEQRTSSYAAEGTAAHELAAHCLKENLPPENFLGSVIDIAAKSPGEMFGNRGLTDNLTRFEVDEEMVEGVRLYVDVVESLKPKDGDFELDVEQRLDMTHLHPDIFGTGDVVLYQVKAGRLHVVDLKYGKGVAVEPEGNPQLMLYGAGAARRYHNRALNEIVLHIVQPRAPHVRGPVRSWVTDPLALLEFEDDIAAAAKRTEAADAPLVAGEHCRFCPAAGFCPALRDQTMDEAMAEFTDEGVTLPVSPGEVSPDKRAIVLRAADCIQNWVKSVQEFEHGEAMAGRCAPGFKLVAKRATRKWRDEDEVRDKLLVELEKTEDDIHVEPKMKSPAQIEAMLGKKPFAKEMSGFVVKASSGVNLVPEEDPRPAVSVDAASEFGG